VIFLCLAHLAGNALLLLLGYYWLGLGESNAAHLAFSAAVLLFFALSAIWLHGTAFIFFRIRNFGAATATVLRHLLPLFVLSLGVLLLYLALQHVYYSFGHQAFNIGSYTTMKLRRPVAPNNVLKAFHFFIWLLRWFVVPVLTLPVASEVSSHGWSGFNWAAFQKCKSILYWLEASLLLLAATHIPLHLFYWIPKVPNFSLEVLSVIVRMGLGYLIFTAGLLAVEFFTSAGKPPTTQLSTTPSP